MAATHFSGPVISAAGFEGSITASGPTTLATYTVANAPAATTAGQIIYLSNGAAGAPVLAFSNGTNWLRCDTLATAAAT